MADDDLLRRIGDHDARVLADPRDRRRPLRLLEAIPGVSLASACAILVELGPDLVALPNSRKLDAWAGVGPGNNQSARKGNPTLRAILTECAYWAVCTKRAVPQLPPGVGWERRP